MENRTYAQRLINDYSDKPVTKTDSLKALDKKVRKSPKIFSYIFGSIGSLILGTGMCLAMQVIGSAAALKYIGVGIGLVGILMVSVNYYLYKKMLARRKRKYAGEILRLSGEILGE